ncbi:MAG: hypothetical protein JOZ30_09335 [Hyphomicrobiales bacterium]|nr:hypothetical protein [Hyphomicrobiales bacterium]
MFTRSMSVGVAALFLSALSLAPAQAERGEGSHGGGGAFHGGGGSFHGGGGSAFHGGGGAAFHAGGMGGFHGGVSAFRGGPSAFRGGTTAFNGGAATINRGAASVSPFHGTVHAFNSGMRGGIREPFRGAWAGHYHHRHRYAWWGDDLYDEPYYGPCVWRHRWIWNGFRQVRERVRFCI